MSRPKHTHTWTTQRQLNPHPAHWRRTDSSCEACTPTAIRNHRSSPFGSVLSKFLLNSFIFKNWVVYTVKSFYSCCLITIVLNLPCVELLVMEELNSFCSELRITHNLLPIKQNDKSACVVTSLCGGFRAVCQINPRARKQMSEHVCSPLGCTIVQKMFLHYSKYRTHQFRDYVST